MKVEHLAIHSTLLDDRRAVLRQAPRDLALADLVQVVDAPLELVEGEVRGVAISLGFLPLSTLARVHVAGLRSLSSAAGSTYSQDSLGGNPNSQSPAGVVEVDGGARQNRDQ